MLSRVRRALAGGGFAPVGGNDADVVLRRSASNPYRRWHSGASTQAGAAQQDASARIFTGMADIKARYEGPRLCRQDGVFAIGSCFAREIEHHLSRHGARVLSLTEDMEEAACFGDTGGRPLGAFFHRFAPQAIWQDVARAFDAIPGWDESSTLIFRSGRGYYDFDQTWLETSDASLEAVLERRRLAGVRGRRLEEAACVVITLGLIEAWRHRPTGLWCNKVHPYVLKRMGRDFEFHLTSYEEALESLEAIHALLSAHGRPGVQLVVTVSPVPLQVTFTDRDVVEANAESKAVLRAAAAAFVRRHANAHYFPSYEMVTFSEAKRAWKPDMVHVKSPMVNEVVSRFMALYYQPVEGVAAAR
jgi:hypothetical protein